MANFRRKSCHQCRSSKVSCDRKQPRCSRCELRKTPCRYSPVSRFSRSVINNNKFQISPASTHQTAPSDELACSSSRASSEVADVASTILPDTLELNHVETAALPGHDVLSGYERACEWPPATCDIDEHALWSYNNFSNYSLFSAAGPRLDNDGEIVSDIIADIDEEILRRSIFRKSFLVDECFLCPRQSRTAEASLTSKMMLGTIQTYPEMLIDGMSLPEFISPPCCGDELRCRDSGSHQCLPEALAICAGIIRSSRPQCPGNRAFLWRTIYTEQQRLFREVCGLMV